MKKNYLKSLFIVTLTFVVTGNAQTNVVVSEDTYAQFSTPDTPQGATLDVRAKSSAGAERIGWLKFNITGFSSITSATLNLPSWKNLEAAYDLTISKGPDTWTEATLTWNNKPTIGAAITSAPIRQTNISPETTNTRDSSLGIDVTAYVIEEFNGDKIVSFALTNEVIASGMIRLDSKESTFAAPYLSITGTTLGVSKLTQGETSMYPNPVTNGELFISSKNNLQKDVIIYSLLGKKLIEKNNVTNSINVSQLAKGAYILKIKQKDATVETKKFIVQ